MRPVRLPLLLLLLWLSAMSFVQAAEPDAQAIQVEQTLDYAAFIDAIETVDQDALKAYIEPDAKMGNGGDVGIKGFHTLMHADPSCLPHIVLALRQGCKRVDQNHSSLCVAPPQSQDAGVIYAASNVTLRWHAATHHWQVVMLECYAD